MNGLPYYVEQGSGDVAVLLLHGVGGGHHAFDATLPVLASAGYRAIAWDAPGYGASRIQEPCSMTLFANALQQLISHINAPRLVVLGHSMGGMIAQEALARGVQAIDGLVLFATSAAFGKPGGEWQQEFLKSRFATLDTGLGMAGLAPVLVGSMLALGATASVRAAAVNMMSLVPESVYRAALAAIVTFNRLQALPNISVPTLCLACDGDKTAPPEALKKMAETIPLGQYGCIAQAGHLGNMEQPAAFNAIVLAFLKQHFSPTRSAVRASP